MISVCLYLYLWNSNLVLIYLCYCYCFVHQAWVPRNPPGNNPMPGLVCGWLCWELKILWKCYQPVFMYSLISTPNKELSLFWRTVFRLSFISKGCPSTPILQFFWTLIKRGGVGGVGVKHMFKKNWRIRNSPTQLICPWIFICWVGGGDSIQEVVKCLSSYFRQKWTF